MSSVPITILQGLHKVPSVHLLRFVNQPMFALYEYYLIIKWQLILSLNRDFSTNQSAEALQSKLAVDINSISLLSGEYMRQNNEANIDMNVEAPAYSTQKGREKKNGNKGFPVGKSTRSRGR